MKTPRNELSIAKRLAAGFTVILVMMIVLTALSIFKVNTIEASLSRVSDVNNVKERYAINFRGSVHDRAIAVRDVTLVANGDVDSVVALIDKLDKDYQDSAQPLDSLFSAAGAKIGPEERDWLDKIKQAEVRTMPLVRNIVEARRAGNIEGARQMMLAEAKPAFVDWLTSINAFIDLQEKMSEAESLQARQIAHNFWSLMLALVAAAVAIGAVVAWRVTHYLQRALGAEPAEVKALANAVDRGELYHEVALRSGDQDSIMAVLMKMSRNLRLTVTEVHDTANAVTGISAQISERNVHLSARTEDQATSLEETASAMGQLTATVKQNAESAQEANALAQEASDIATQGGEIVGEVVDTMNSINDSSRRIVEIVSMIDGIAFQTNILALNAAVEAARAGEQGRGFAVVATEVRNLAQRSSTAAREVKALIDESVEKIHTGTRLVENAGSTMRDIVQSVKQVTDMVGDITVASNEQRTGIEEVNRAISLMDHVTQQNATLVEQAAGDVQTLQDQAAHLNHAVGVFKTAPMPHATARRSNESAVVPLSAMLAAPIGA